MSKVLKRGATSGLTRDNWEEEDAPEEIGVFQKATTDELKTRPMIKARRRGERNDISSDSSVFKSFSLNKSEIPTLTTPSFSFLNNAPSLNPSFALPDENKSNIKLCSSALKSTNKISENVSISNNKLSLPLLERNEKSNNVSKNRESYLCNLKNLNLTLLSWIKVHIEKSAYINMTPIFDDYKSHLDELEKKYNSNDKVNEIGASSESSSPVMLKGKISTGNSLPVASSNIQNGFNLDVISEKKEPELPTFGFPKMDKGSSFASPMFSFGTSNNKSIFTQGGNEQDSKQGSTDKPAFSFGLSKVNNVSLENGNVNQEKKENPEDTYEPPQEEVTEIEEENAIYKKKCKLFYKKEDAYVDRGVGTLYLKSVGDKTQLLIRAATNLGNILLNIVLNESLPLQRVGKNNVLIVCIPNPPINPKDASTPVSMLIRVKTSEDADQLLETLAKYKKAADSD